MNAIQITCKQCQKRFILCCQCYRGQVYCSSNCKRLGYLSNKRRANKKYSLKFASKIKQSIRQKRFREKSKYFNIDIKATDHTSEKIFYKLSYIQDRCSMCNCSITLVYGLKIDFKRCKLYS
jgi:hypothetical protein